MHITNILSHARTPMEGRTGVETYRIHLGQLGRSGTALADEVATAVKTNIPKLEKLFASGALQPLDYVVAGEGFEGVLEGLKLLNEGKVKGQKIVVRLQHE
jgi:hypothetical protein